MTVLCLTYTPPLVLHASSSSSTQSHKVKQYTIEVKTHPQFYAIVPESICCFPQNLNLLGNVNTKKKNTKIQTHYDTTNKYKLKFQNK